MKKRRIGRKFSRERDQRKALLTSLMRGFFVNGTITTTEAKARDLARKSERMITRVKTGSLATRRELSFLNSSEVKTFIDTYVVKFKDRNGGYTRILKLGPRMSNGAKMAVVEFVS